LSERYIVTEFLELAQLAHGDGMPQMEVGSTGIVAAVDAQRSPGLFGLDQTLM
jgi:hypothetical protein